MNDDDLPVLTQVLRTGSGHREAPLVAPPESPQDPRDAALDVRPVEETWLADQLVIGHQPQRLIDDYLMQTNDAVAAPFETQETLDAAGPGRADSFQLPQDHDGGGAPTGTGNATFGVPHLRHTAGEPALDPRSPPVPREDPAVFARRVRDAVLEDLRNRIDTELDARIAQVMHAEVETALAQLQVNLRAHLTEALRDVVQRAVDEEVARIAAPSSPDRAT